VIEGKHGEKIYSRAYASACFLTIAKFPDFGLDNPVQLVNPIGKFLRIGFPRDPVAEIDHSITIFGSHGGQKPRTRYVGVWIPLFALDQRPSKYFFGEGRNSSGNLQGMRNKVRVFSLENACDDNANPAGR